MNNSDFTIVSKSYFIYLREVLAVLWCEAKAGGILGAWLDPAV